MHNRMPSRKRQSVTKGKGGPRQGNTVPLQGETQVHARAPRAPHERDESADSQVSSEPSGPRMANAGREDVERGLVDTDKGPVLEQTYDKLRDSELDPVKKLSP